MEKTDNDIKKHLRQVRRQLYRNLFAAYRGWWQWHKIIHRKGISDKTAIILLPSQDREINYMSLLYLDMLLENRGYKNAVILTHDPAVLKGADLFSQSGPKVIKFNRKKSEDLMQYYCLYEFDKRLVIASLDEPNGRRGSALIGKRGTTKEEIFVIGVYRIYPFERPEAPPYDGDDPDILELLKARGQL